MRWALACVVWLTVHGCTTIGYDTLSLDEDAAASPQQTLAMDGGLDGRRSEPGDAKPPTDAGPDPDAVVDPDVDPPDAADAPDASPDATPDAGDTPDASPDANLDAGATCDPGTNHCSGLIYTWCGAGGREQQTDCSLATDACLVATCDPLDGCGAAPSNEGGGCSDGLFCTTGETCDRGTCTNGTPRDCSGDTDQCNVGSCDEGTDSCYAAPSNEGGGCDGALCTSGETCSAGACTGGGGVSGPGCLSLVASWNFDGNGEDDVGTNDASVLTGVSYETGIAGDAIRLGTSSAIWVPDSASLDFSSGLTLEAWVMPDSVPATGRVGIIDHDGAWGLFIYGGGLPRCTARSTVLSATAITAGVWSHIACTYDGSFARIYVDGVLTDSAPASGSFNTSGTGPLAIGGNSPSGDRFRGLMDTLRVWDAALPASEICAIAGACP